MGGLNRSVLQVICRSMNFPRQFEFARVTEEMSRVFRRHGAGQRCAGRNAGAFSSGVFDADGFLRYLVVLQALS